MTKLLFMFSVALMMASAFDLRGQNQLPARGRSQTPLPLAGQNSDAPLPEGTKFDLDFKGGTPAELVKAIEAAWHKPLNAVIPDEIAKTQLPALRMKAVTLSQLFEALAAASSRTVAQVTGSTTVMNGGRAQYTFTQSSFGFRTGGRALDDSIWYFYFQQPAVVPEIHQPKICRFYQLAPILESYKIEDITTAIRTGWGMLGEKSPPEMNFHKDTKLLIVVAEEDKLKLIDSLLEQLRIAPKTSEPTKRGDGKSQ